jgi:uncharacterized protein YoxC
MNRLEILAKIDELHDGNCKGCKYFDSNYEENTRRCKSCEIREQLQGLGQQLQSIKKERKPLGEKKPVLDIDSYRDYKALGKTDADIARDYGIKQPTLSYYKKKWEKNGNQHVLKAVESENEQEPTNVNRRGKESELGALVNELSGELDNKNKLVAELQAKVKELENINAACTDVEEETNELQLKLDHERKAKEWAQAEYSKTLNQLHKTDAALENMKNLDLTHQKAINRYVKENKALRELVSLWI